GVAAGPDEGCSPLPPRQPGSPSSFVNQVNKRYRRGRVWNDRCVRVAVISDVHGNLPALEAALAAAEAERPDRIVFGGDLVWGPLPREALERIMALDGALFVRGDADRDVVDREGEVSEW